MSHAATGHRLGHDPAAGPPNRPPTVRHESDVHGFVARTCFKHGPPASAGVESEWFAVDPAQPHRPVPIATLRTLLDPVLPLPSGSVLSFEPGGQLELSTAVSYAGSQAAIDRLARDLEAVTGALAGAGLHLIASGADPQRPPVRQLDHPRYAAMQAYFDRRGSAGRSMMMCTAAVQICLGAGADAAEVSGRWHAANALAPVLIAMFANSPLHNGARSGWHSTRQRFWHDLDRRRTCAPEGEDPVAAYTRYALAAPVMLIRRAGADWIADPGVTFAQWMAGALPQPPDETDLAYHLSTLFPPVRAHGWLELRPIDALPAPWWQVAVALTSVLVTDGGARDAARDACEPVRGRARTAARTGLSDPQLHRAASRCLEAATAALHRAGASADLVRAVDAFAERYVSRGRTPADDVLDAHRGGAPPWVAAAAAGKPQPTKETV